MLTYQEDNIYIGTGLLSFSSLWLPLIESRSVCVISDEQVASHYLASLEATCRSAGVRSFDYYLITPGETSKTLETANRIWTFLLERYYDRDAVLIALGGGVVGDLAGFCGACYLRGIAVIQCPTSLLGQIDAGLGGKTAVNHPLGKNMVGAFHMPKAIIIDLLALRTLPDRAFRSAMAELIKYALIADESLFVWLEQNMERLLARDLSLLQEAVVGACKIKMKIVSQDVKDKNIRAILNFGHTVGHAIESLLNYNEWQHGEAVAVGMIVATHLSWQRHNIDKSVLDRLIKLLYSAHLPKNFPEGITNALILARIKQDKKHTQGILSWVLLKALGCAVPGNIVETEDVWQALTFCSSIR